MLQGYRTYIVALGVIGTAVAAFAHGDTTLVQTIDQILSGLGLAALRAGVAGVSK